MAQTIPAPLQVRGQLSVLPPPAPPDPRSSIVHGARLVLRAHAALQHRAVQAYITEGLPTRRPLPRPPRGLQLPAHIRITGPTMGAPARELQPAPATWATGAMGPTGAGHTALWWRVGQLPEGSQGCRPGAAHVCRAGAAVLATGGSRARPRPLAAARPLPKCTNPGAWHHLKNSFGQARRAPPRGLQPPNGGRRPASAHGPIAPPQPLMLGSPVFQLECLPDHSPIITQTQALDRRRHPQAFPRHPPGNFPGNAARNRNNVGTRCGGRWLANVLAMHGVAAAARRIPESAALRAPAPPGQRLARCRRAQQGAAPRGTCTLHATCQNKQGCMHACPCGPMCPGRWQRPGLLTSLANTWLATRRPGAALVSKAWDTASCANPTQSASQNCGQSQQPQATAAYNVQLAWGAGALLQRRACKRLQKAQTTSGRPSATRWHRQHRSRAAAATGQVTGQSAKHQRGWQDCCHARPQAPRA